MRFIDQIPALVELQNLDLNMDRITVRIEAIPGFMLQEEEAVTRAESALQEARERSKVLEAHRKKLELEIESFRTQTAKLETQLLSVKTNKEYQALLKEISERKEAAFQREDAVLDVMEQLETTMGEILKWEEDLRKAQERLAREREEIRGELADLNKSLAEKKALRDQVAKEIDKGLLARYEKVRSNRGGIAIAKFEDGTCSQCHMDVRPQLQNDVKIGERPIPCETCHRILYVIPRSMPEA